MATERYNPRDAEPRWQAKWSEDKVFETKNEVASTLKAVA